jgi:hypothetical protein
MNSLITMQALLDVQVMVQNLKAADRTNMLLVGGSADTEASDAYDKVLIGLQPIVEKYGEFVTKELEKLG